MSKTIIQQLNLLDRPDTLEFLKGEQVFVSGWGRGIVDFDGGGPVWCSVKGQVYPFRRDQVYPLLGD
jgi:hypothetical protein